MSKDKETPEVRREKMRQAELKNPSSSIHGSNLADLVGGLNWIGMVTIILVIVIGGGYLLLKSTSPMEFDTIASSEGNESIIIGIVNNGFRDAKIVDISVNDNEIPLEVQLQVTNASQGLSITDEYTIEEAKDDDFTDIEEIAIKPDTSLEEETASKDDEIYSVNVLHSEEINNVYIEYRHFGMTFNDTVYVNAY